MRLNKLLLIACFAVPSIGFSQNRWDFGVKVGASAGLCDIGGIQRGGSPLVINVQPSQIRWDLGAYIRYKIVPAFSISAQFDYVRLQGFDSLSKVTSIRDRNLNYRDDIFEAYVRAEWTFFEITDIGGFYHYKNSFNAYLFIGAGLFHMNPEAMITESTPPAYVGSYGTYIPLHTLTTEGESEYSLIQPTIPMGIGFYYTLNRTYKLGWELAWDKTFTDYIDDVSGKYPNYGNDANLPNPYSKYMSSQSAYVPGITAQELANYGPGSPRGNPKNLDSFVTTAITFGIVIHTKPPVKTKRNIMGSYRSRASF